jgi:hypothetical protein
MCAQLVRGWLGNAALHHFCLAIVRNGASGNQGGIAAVRFACILLGRRKAQFMTPP